MPETVSMRGAAQKLTIYIGESDRWRGKALYMAILETLKVHGLAGATVTRGVAGFGAHSRIRTASIERLSQDLPLRIEVVDEAERITLALEYITPLVQEGLITLEDVQVVKYTHRLLNPLPAEKLVSEVMTRQVITLRPDTSLAEAWQTMVRHLLKALPVVNEKQEVLGILREDDLLGYIHTRPGLADKLDAATLQAELINLRKVQTPVSEVMKTPAITARADEPLGVAAARMAGHEVKRLPVLDEAGRLVGVLSRSDILGMVMDKSGKTTHAPEGTGKTVGEVMYPQVPTLQPEAGLAEIVELLLETGLRRVVVTGDDRQPLGLISDNDVVARVAPKEQKGVLEALLNLGRPPQSQATARSLMSAGVLSATPETPLLEAAQKMFEQKRKWLVVVDHAGKVAGLVDRQVLLRALTAG